MLELNTTAAVADFCQQCAKHPYVTVDTEFVRERTYYSKLCLIQLAHPGDGDDCAALIDPLADGVCLDPLYALFQDQNVLKVFHAARQDLEIFLQDTGKFPTPFFDTQIAAMVCGYGEQIGYDRLVKSINGAVIDKSSRFTDWSARPLKLEQKQYALADVTHLRDVYEHLSKQLQKTNRAHWLAEELAQLTDPATYDTTPENAWRRIKIRSSSWKMKAAVKELAAFREHYAQQRNIPRNRVYKDDALLELAASKPQKTDDFKRLRLLLRDARKGDIANGIIEALQKAKRYSASDFGHSDAPAKPRQGREGLLELLRVLLKARADEFSVAPKLIAPSAELEAIAYGDTDSAVFSGWRAEIFGNAAKDLLAGKVALAANGKKVRLITLSDAP